MLWCLRDFFVSGKGTGSPWDPPKHLVVVGLYRFTRNPMYIGVLLVVGGWAIVAGSPLIGAYLIPLAVVLHLRIIFKEEPWMFRKFGQDWARYSKRVPRWFPRTARR
ncbi:MAG: isoprenylcysteine carboxylmethyltransferase family protein [Desulfomonile sp.]